MSEVEFQLEGGTAIITLNRPEAKNALNGAVMDGLRAAFAKVVNDPEVRVAILTGAGGSFCAGMDLKAFARGEPIDGGGLPFSGENTLVLDKPLIAAVEGFCLAGGFEVALSCDFIVASEAARFGLPEVKRGLAAAGGGLVRLPTQAPWRVALELALTGDMVSAERLERCGVINRLAPEGKALDVARAFAASIAENGPLAVAMSKRVMRESREWAPSEAMQKQRVYTDPVFASEDAKEGATAFAEKRKPVWKGR
ncbi:MAG: crotonase/enoyl-CoA hydratase family protein [Caulobacteraceae bacterium]|nr:crotonase/enoyl-CoA hydratase family protein [Caulobacteraceae bacterium]